MVENEPQGSSIEVDWPLDETTVHATLVSPQGTRLFPCTFRLGQDMSVRLLAGAGSAFTASDTFPVGHASA